MASISFLRKPSTPPLCWCAAARPNKEPSVLTWSRKPSTGMLQILCCSDSYLRKDKCLFLQLRPLGGCDVTPFCHVQSFFEVLSLCSHFPSPAGIWFLTSLHDGHWSCASRCLLCYIRDASSHPTNQCRTIFSAPILLLQQASSSHTLSVSRALPPISPDRLACFKSIFFTPCGQTHPHFHGHLPFKKQGVPLRVIPESRVSHITAAAGPLTCLHGTHLHGLQKSASLFFHVLDGVMQLTVTPVPEGLKKSLISATSTPRCVSSAANFFRPPSSHAISSKSKVLIASSLGLGKECSNSVIQT